MTSPTNLSLTNSFEEEPEPGDARPTTEPPRDAEAAEPPNAEAAESPDDQSRGSTDDEGLADEPAPATAPSAGRSWGWIPWLLAIVLAGLLAWMWFGELRPLQQAEDDRDTVRSAAVNFLTQLTNWDAAEGLNDTQDELIALGTEAFATEVNSVFSAMDDLVAAEARSTATIEDLFVQSIEDDAAVVFGVVEQTITTNTPGEPSVVLRSFRATFVPSDGGWLVQRMELVAEQQVSGGTPGVPNIGDESPEPTATETATAPESSASEPATDNNATGGPSEETTP